MLSIEIINCYNKITRGGESVYDHDASKDGYGDPGC